VHTKGTEATNKLEDVGTNIFSARVLQPEVFLVCIGLLQLQNSSMENSLSSACNARRSRRGAVAPGNSPIFIFPYSSGTPVTRLTPLKVSLHVFEKQNVLFGWSFQRGTRCVCASRVCASFSVPAPVKYQCVCVCSAVREHNVCRCGFMQIPPPLHPLVLSSSLSFSPPGCYHTPPPPSPPHLKMTKLATALNRRATILLFVTCPLSRLSRCARER